MGAIFMIALLVDPMINVFEFEPLKNQGIAVVTRIVDFMIIFDMLLVPFTATEKEDQICVQEQKQFKEDEGRCSN